MISIKELNKYYYKGKSNEIHAVNNTTLDFPNKGLVCLLGPSGCGKTTLLNIIGGLDKPSSGVITYNNLTLNRKQLDEYRAKNIGFIFQNYCLLPNLTVYENLKIILNMFNLSNDEINERIEYALKACNMFKYRKRMCNQLSGGQMQRVAIARALVKSPELIIADEPTGNLDEKNTKQIMDLIKNLSRECLVIMVTHETRLANFYSDRYITIQDGKVIEDVNNTKKEFFSSKDDVNIYLGDMNEEKIVKDNVFIRYFYTTEKPEIKIDIIFKNDMYYLKASSDTPNIKFSLVTGSSESMIIEGKKPEIVVDDVIENDFSFPKINKEKTRKSVISFKESFKEALKFFKNQKMGTKLKLFIFFLSAFMLVTAIAGFGNVMHVEKRLFNAPSEDIAVIHDESMFNAKDVEETLNDGLLMPNIQMETAYIYFDYFKKTNIFVNSMIPFPVDKLDNNMLLCGRKPINNNEVVIDKLVIDSISIDTIEGNSLKELGFEDYEQLLNIEILLNGYEKNYKIVGVSNYNANNIYLTERALKRIYLNYVLYDKDEIGISQTYVANNSYKYYMISDTDEDFFYYNEISGIGSNIYRKYLSKDEIVVSFSIKNMLKEYIKNPTNDFVFSFLASKTIVGSINSTDELIIGNDEFIDEFYYKAIENQHSYVVNKDNLLKLQNVETYDVYNLYLENHKQNKFYGNIASIITATVLFVVSSIFLVFTIRTSVIERVYQIGVYRAFGVPKKDIYKIFVVETLVIMSVTSFIGYILGSIFATSNMNSLLINTAYYPWYSWLISFVLIFGINIIISLIPIIILLRLTPARILSKYDI